jgi:hypothetical protein
MKLATLFGSTAIAIACAAPLYPAVAGEPAPANVERDGSHDFDFGGGLWKTHLKRRAHALSGSTEFIELNGTVNTRAIWGGRAHLEQIEADGPNGHWQGLSLFLYDPASHQWSQTFVNSKTGTVDAGLIGSFKNGRGELFESDTVDGRAIRVRGVWSKITSTSHRYEESYSADGGKTWEVELTADKTKAAPNDAPIVENTDGSHEFDFDFGTWQTHTSRMLHPLSGAREWVDVDGTTVVTPIWGGRANIAEHTATGATGPVQSLALYTFNPKTREWNVNFATSSGGKLSSTPGRGRFSEGRVDFYDKEPINGKSVLVRFSMWGITPDTAQSEQAFSTDDGKTWEVNWINKYTRKNS